MIVTRKGSVRIKPILLAISLSFLFHAHTAASLNSQNNQEKLSQILNKTADYCERVKKIALYYVCLENTKDKKYFYR